MPIYSPLKALDTLIFTLLISSVVQANDDGLHPFFLNGGPAKPATQDVQQQPSVVPDAASAASFEAEAPVQYVTTGEGLSSRLPPDEHYIKSPGRRVEGRVDDSDPRPDERKILNPFPFDLFGSGEDSPPKPPVNTLSQSGETAQSQAITQQRETIYVEDTREDDSPFPKGPRRDEPRIYNPINF